MGIDIIEGSWLGRRPSYKHATLRNKTFIEDYAVVTSADIGPLPNSESHVLVTLELKRLSDGLESKFQSKEYASKMRLFLNEVKDSSTPIDYLKGGVVDVRYVPNKNEVLQVKANEYFFEAKKKLF